MLRAIGGSSPRALLTRKIIWFFCAKMTSSFSFLQKNLIFVSNCHWSLSSSKGSSLLPFGSSFSLYMYTVLCHLVSLCLPLLFLRALTLKLSRSLLLFAFCSFSLFLSYHFFCYSLSSFSSFFHFLFPPLKHSRSLSRSLYFVFFPSWVLNKRKLRRSGIG